MNKGNQRYIIKTNKLNEYFKLAQTLTAAILFNGTY